MSLNAIGLKFSCAHNSLYGLAEFTAMLLKMCDARTTAQTASARIGNGPSARWLLGMIRTIQCDDMKSGCDNLLAETVQMSKKELRKLGPLNVAIDKHLIPRHDKSMLNLIYSKMKGGTKKFECYGTMRAVGCSIGTTLSCIPVDRLSDNVDLVRNFVKTCKESRIRTNLFLFDREFYAVGVMRAIASDRKTFLMPAIKNTGIKKAIMEHATGKRGAVSRYTLRSSDGTTFQFNLVLVKVDEPKGDLITDRYVAFATNLPLRKIHSEMSKIPDEYRKRWAIETGYRQAEQLRPRTTSTNQSVRLLLFYVSLVVCNLWGMERTGKIGSIKLAIMVNLALTTALDECGIIGQPHDPG